jgi:tRNA nucleotidyltransferase (CCA-adding enzyme)
VAAERFAEDGLRPLRAVRFAAVLGFRLDPATRQALSGALDTFALVAWERKREEMARLLTRGRDFTNILAVLRESGMLALLSPELVPARRLGALDRLPEGEPWLRFAAWAQLAGCTPAQAGEVLLRWRVATKDQRAVIGWLDGLEKLKRRRLPDAIELRRWLATVGEEGATGAAQLAAALWGGAFTQLPRRLGTLLRQAPVVRLDQLAVRGGDLVQLGLTGPAVGQTLQTLLEAVIVDPRKNRKTTLMGLANKLSTGSP